MMSGVSIILFGSLSRFTLLTLEKLIGRELKLNGIVLAAYPPSPFHSADLSVQLHRSGLPAIVELANRHRIPICFFTGESERLTEFLYSRPADLYILSCYPRKLPQSIAAIAEHCCINIHPSKLPKYRGADPIFWQLRSGETNTGVTLHKVADAIDCGDILAIDSIAYPTGARLSEIQSILLEGAIACLNNLLRTPLHSWHFESQNHTESSWHPAPCEEDFTIQADVSARAAFNFVRAYSNLSIKVKTLHTAYVVQDALRYEAPLNPTDRVVESECISVPFSDGNVEFLLTHTNRSNKILNRKNF